jgi:ATP-dependent RNA circularization protein (DNA/RNA ligase family)
MYLYEISLETIYNYNTGYKKNCMEPDEKRITQEDCSEDSLGSGILTLTNKRIAFDKTEGRIMDFSKKFGKTVLEANLNQITEVAKEGRIIKKIRIKIKTDEDEKTFKFGVYNTGKWEKDVKEAISKYSS